MNMPPFDYRFTFSELGEGPSSARMYTSANNLPYLFQIGVNKSDLHRLCASQVSPIASDLIDLAVCIQYADKLIRPRNDYSIKVHLDICVLHPDRLNFCRDKLSELMEWYTGDKWTFQFLPVKNIPKRKSIMQQKIKFLTKETENIEFALWSGGLDSFAGLVARLLQNPFKRFVLIGTGSNGIMHKAQRRAFRKLGLESNNLGRISYCAVPLYAGYSHRRGMNSLHRARGVVFLLVGAACAIANNSWQLSVYENGVGAINLALPAGVGRDHSRAVHPVSLEKVSAFISKFADRECVIENPFSLITKGQMLSMVDMNKALIFETISCDKPHRERPIQCGYCTSCLLRKQSLAVAGIEDKTQYLIPFGRNPRAEYFRPLQQTQKQLQILKKTLRNGNPWQAMTAEYPDLIRIGITEFGTRNQVRNTIPEMYKTYVHEWEQVGDLIDGMLNQYPYPQTEVQRWHQMPLVK